MKKAESYPTPNYPMYARHPLDDFGKNGFCRYLVDGGHIADLIKRGKDIAMSGTLIRDYKDAGAMKLDKATLSENSTYYAELLSKTGLFRAIQEDVNSTVFPRKITHMISDKSTKTLLWHRDSYQHNGKQIGPLIPPLKLVVYLTDVDEHSGATGINPLLCDTDFNNRYIDKLMAFLLKPFAKLHHLNAGSAILFDGRLLHCRTAHKRGQFRQAIIFSLSRDPTQLPTMDEIPTVHFEQPFGLLHALMKNDQSYERRILQALNTESMQ